ncbi:MAG: hypothetical protein N2Z79_03240 [Candidatus Omnitrophica bacterium]|nr:hypothetical protein [Candidatus Omnitrophota bacterium]
MHRYIRFYKDQPDYSEILNENMRIAQRMRAKNIFFFWILVVLFLNTGFCEEVSIKELIDNYFNYNGKEVEIYGEVIGQVMKRRDSFWINVCRDKACMGVWGEDLNLVKPIKYARGYNRRGDWLKIKGTFNYPCKEHLGETDIHAKAIEVVFEGEEFFPNLNRSKVILSIVLCGGLLLLWISKRLEKAST